MDCLTAVEMGSKRRWRNILSTTRYDQAKQEAAKLKPGRYLMQWIAGGMLHTRNVILITHGGHICYHYADEDVIFAVSVHSAILTGTTFTPENNDAPTQYASGDLLSQLCTVDIVGISSLD